MIAAACRVHGGVDTAIRVAGHDDGRLVLQLLSRKEHKLVLESTDTWEVTRLLQSGPNFVRGRSSAALGRGGTPARTCNLL